MTFFEKCRIAKDSTNLPVSRKNHRLPDGVGTNGVVAEVPQ